jgi:hypothetical protein
MKKVFQLACVIALAAGFVACGGAATSTSTTDSTATAADSIMAVDTTAADSLVIEVTE